MKRFFNTLFCLAIVVFSLVIMTISSDAGSFSSPMGLAEESMSNEIFLRYMDLINYSNDWQKKWLEKIKKEMEKSLAEIARLEKRIKFDPEGYNGTLYLIWGDIESEVGLILNHQIRLRLDSEEWEFRNVLKYWKSLRTHSESPLTELKKYLQQKQE